MNTSNFSTDIHFAMTPKRKSLTQKTVASKFCLRIYNALEEINFDSDEYIINQYEASPKLSSIKRSIDCISELSI